MSNSNVTCSFNFYHIEGATPTVNIPTLSSKQICKHLPYKQISSS